MYSMKDEQPSYETEIETPFSFVGPVDLLPDAVSCMYEDP